MVDVKLDISELDRAIIWVDNLPVGALFALQDGLEDGGNDLVKDIKMSMRNTLRDYDVGYKRGNKIHHPSAPGNPPAIDSGELWRSIIMQVMMPSGIEVGATAGAPYAGWLEDGTEDGTMEARPWLEPALDRLEEQINRKIRQRVQSAMERR